MSCGARTWRRLPLRRFSIDVQTGPFGSQLHASDYVFGGTPIINATHIRDGRIEPSNAVTASPETVERLALHQLLPNDLIFGRRGEAARVARVTGRERGWLCGTGSIRLRVKDSRIDQRFLTWFCGSSLVANELESVGGRSTMLNLNDEILKSLAIPAIDVVTQRRVADFLDRETERIDALVEKKRRLIELLEERRAALISQVVTKGLDPTVPMKESGIPWLGQIPAHWEVRRLKFVSIRIQTGSTPPTAAERFYDDGAVPWFGPASFSSHVCVGNPVKLLNMEAVSDGGLRLFPAGTVMLVGIGATLGKAGLLESQGSANQQVIGIVPSEVMDSDYLALQAKLWEAPTRGSAPQTTMPILTQTQLGATPTVVPKRVEQEAIAAKLRTSDADLRMAVSMLSKQLDLLTEYRQALITAAVTGQIDVGAEAPDPEEALA